MAFTGVSVMDSFEPTIVLGHEAIIGGFKCLYWLVKNEHAHHTNYPKLLSLAELLRCDYFKKLKVTHLNLKTNVTYLLSKHTFNLYIIDYTFLISYEVPFPPFPISSLTTGIITDHIVSSMTCLRFYLVKLRSLS